MTVNVGIVGTGIFATDRHLPTLKKIPDLNTAGCYNRTKSKAEEFAKKTGNKNINVYDLLEEIIQSDELDFVDVLLPVQFNLNAVKTAVKYGKPICLEKPIAANLEQAREIVKISRETDLPITVLENWSFLKAREILEEEILPKIGNIVSFTYRSTGAWNENNKYLNTSWRKNPEHIGGFLSDGGVHQLALLTDVLGQVETVSAHTKQVREESGADDILFSIMKLTSGVIGTFTYGSAFGATEKSTSFIIYGTNGSVVYDFSPHLPKPVISYRIGKSMQLSTADTNLEVENNDTFKEEFENFISSVTKKDKSLVKVKPENAFHHLAIIAAALESSAKNGNTIAVEQV